MCPILNFSYFICSESIIAAAIKRIYLHLSKPAFVTALSC